jgi:YVTN family beta-propeller protein
MNELPRGAVTFLFTDIEGSTQLVRALRDRYPEVLAEHQRLLREAFAKHGGHEIDTQGDSFFYAFASAHEAVLAAVEAQRALSGYPWPNGAPVKVRMGIHTGQAAPVDGRYTGLAVHRAARIQAAAHGGQVLVSQATQSLLEDEEEDLAVNLRDLGDQRLKDIQRPVRVYQVAAPGLPADFPPLRQEAEPTDLAVALPVPVYRRPLVLGGAALILAGLLVAGILVLTRSGGGGLSGVGVNNVGVIDPETNQIVDEIPVGRRPGPIDFGAGSVWVGNSDDKTLSRVDPRRESTPITIPLERRTPTGIDVGANGVWVAHGILGSVARIDPEFNQPTANVQVTRGGGANEGAVAVGGGSVWAVFGDSTLARISPNGPRVAGPTGFAGASPTGIVYAEGSVWVANGGEATVSRFNPETFSGGQPVAHPSVGRRPSAIAYGAGRLWVPNAADDTVTRIDLASNGTRTIVVGDEPTAVTFGAGAVWVTNSGDGTVSRIDLATEEVVATIETGNRPAGVAAGANLVWVTVQAR